MLILVQKGEKQGGFFLKRKAKRGKLPPTVVGLQVGGSPCVLLKLYGEVTPGNRFLAPYLQRGDVLIPSVELEKLGFHLSYLEEMIRRQCVNTAKKWVKTRRKGHLTVLYDPLANCMGVAAEFCALGKGVWVVSPRLQEYAPCFEYTALAYGNPPVLSHEMPCRAQLAVAPYKTERVAFPPGIPVVSPGKLWATKEELTMPGEFLHTVPGGFDPVAVAAGCLAVFGTGMDWEARLSLQGKEEDLR